MEKSVWSESVTMPEFDKFHNGNITKVLIIGGGLCGILCAYYLYRAGVEYMLVEKDKIGCGVTHNTTAKITSQHGVIYSKLIKRFGKENAKTYLELNERAIDEFRKICAKIDCDFEEKNAYTYSLKSRENILREVDAVNSLGKAAEFKDSLKLHFETQGAVMFKNQAQFNVMKFLMGISANLNIYENTFIKDIKNNVAVFDAGEIHADIIIVTTHFPFINRYGNYFLKLYQNRSYVCAYEGARNLDGMFVDGADDGMTNSMISAQILTDMVLNENNRYISLYSSERSILTPQLFKNAFVTLTNFIYPTTKRCTHLGCALKLNKYEHSWDCSCHGSRFTCGGEVIDKPAKKDADV